MRGLSQATTLKILENLKKFAEPLGLLQIPSKEWKFGIIKAAVGRASGSSPVIGFSDIIEPKSDWIEEKIRLRKEARDNKDFAAADQIRKDLAEQGIILEDRPDGTTRWKR